MLFCLGWLGSVVASIVIAKRKGFSPVTYGAISLFLGPLGLLLVLLMPAKIASAGPWVEVKTLQDALRQLDFIKAALCSLTEQVNTLTQRINKLLQQEQAPADGQEQGEGAGAGLTATAIGENAVSHDYEEVLARLEKGKPKKEGFEFVFGKYWLNRIGVALFVLGVGFFISYTFKYLNACSKVLIGYAASAGFFIWGNILEKNKKYLRLAWGILGGAWALLYLTTYAMYYIKATRLITDPGLELILLAIASFTAIIYNLKYRSWVVAAISCLLGFITVGLGGIEYSTVIYCAFLITTITYLSYKLDWHQFLLFNICGTYATYIFWLHPQIFAARLVSQRFTVPIYQFHLCFSLLSITWILFSFAIFMLKQEQSQKRGHLIEHSLLNGGFFVVLGLSELYRIRPHLSLSWDIRIWFLLVLTVVYFLFGYLCKRLGRSKSIVLNCGIAFTLIAMAAVIRFPELGLGFFWIWEMLILFVVGVYYKEFVYRVLSGILGCLVVIRLLAVDFTSGKHYLLFGLDIKHSLAIFILAALYFYVLGALARNKRMQEYFLPGEGNYFGWFVVFGTGLITLIFSEQIGTRLLSLGWALQGLAVLVTGFLLRDKVFRVCALSVFCLACLRLFLVDMAAMNTIYKIITFIFLGGILLVTSMIYSNFVIKRQE